MRKQKHNPASVYNKLQIFVKRKDYPYLKPQPTTRNNLEDFVNLNTE